MGTTINILTVNAGSSSVKLRVFSSLPDAAGFDARFSLTVTNIGQPVSELKKVSADGLADTRQLHDIDHATAITTALDELAEQVPLNSIAAVGHRVVHGGSIYSTATLITDEVIATLGKLVDIDPLHAPATLRFINLMRHQFPAIPHVACFDTAFFHDLPQVATIVPISRHYRERGVRRYGFHGLSYQSIMQSFRTAAGEQAADGRVIVAHLGSGASLAALRGGKPVDTTMGFSPASGIVMATRSGDIDPSIATYLASQGVSPNSYARMVNFESGLLGVSGMSADMLYLLQHEATEPAAAEAVELFCYSAAKAVGALAATIDGMDSLIFTGGIGEQSAPIRLRICEKLSYLGVAIDGAANRRHAELISPAGGRVGVHVFQSDEALVLCEQTNALINAPRKELSHE